MAKIKNLQHRSKLHRQLYRPRGIHPRSFEKVYWPYLPLIAVICLLIGLGMRGRALQTSLSHPTSRVLAYADSMQPGQLLTDTNQVRAQASLSGLHDNTKLDNAAQAKANDMVSRNYWDHDTPDGQPPWVFVSSQLYSYQKLGENLATGFNNEGSVINGWMASTPHRTNLLDPKFSEVGFGVARSTNYTAAGGGPMTLVVAFYGLPSTDAENPAVQVKGASTPSKTSHAQLALATLPAAGAATDLGFVLIGATFSLWLTRHMRALKQATKKGKKFAYSHPLFDIGLLLVVALAYLLTRTAGLVH